MSKTFWRNFQRLSVLLGGSLLIFQAFKLLTALRNPVDQVITKEINQSKYQALLPFIIAQAKYETDNYTSALATGFYNLFGMKNAVSRPQLGIRMPHSEFRRYSSAQESILDFIMYLDYVNFPASVKNIDSYVRELKNRRYFEEGYTYYLEGIQKYV